MTMKIAVVGAGFVGSTTAQQIVEQNLGDVVLHDIVEGMPQGKALDMMHSASLREFESKIVGTNNPADYKDSDIVVVTSGITRKPGMIRDDLVQINSKIVGEVAENIKKYAANAIVIIVTNPLDVMVYTVAQKIGFPKERVMGMSGILDSARFRYYIAAELGVSQHEVSAMVLGGHGDDMLLLVREATVSGISIDQLLPKEKIDKIIERTRKASDEIVKLLGTGSAYYTPAASVARMVKCIVHDEKLVIPISAWCTGQYGIKDLYVGVPAKVGRKGVEQILEIKIAPEELAQLQVSSRHLRETITKFNL
jgi:malate dehydrogenase